MADELQQSEKEQHPVERFEDETELGGVDKNQDLIDDMQQKAERRARFFVGDIQIQDERLVELAGSDPTKTLKDRFVRFLELANKAMVLFLRLKKQLDSIREHQARVATAERPIDREHKEAVKAKERFLDRPLMELHQDLRRGIRHPRLAEGFLSRKRRGSDLFGSPDEQFSKTALMGAEADFYNLLRDGLLRVKGISEDARAEIQRASIQIENDFYGAAGETIDALLQRPDIAENKKAKSALEQSRDYLKSREGERNLTAVTERLSNELYDKIGLESPERKEAIEHRRREEFFMRYGEVKAWNPIKMVSKGEKTLVTSEEKIKGDVKAYIAEIGLPKFDKDGNLLDSDGNIVDGIRRTKSGDVVDGEGRVIAAFAEGESVKVVAKSTISDYQFRTSIPPDATDANEWLAGYEAAALESDVVPPTILRQTKGGRMSFQKLIQFPDGSGRTAVSATPSALKSAGIRMDFENAMSVQNREEIAVLHRLQHASDAGAPNIVVVAEGEKLTGYSIDNGLTNPGMTNEIFMSAIFYERAKQEISAESLAKLERYQKRLSDVSRALTSVLRYDVSRIIASREQTVERMLSKKRFEHYKWDLPLGLRDLVRDEEVVDAQGNKREVRISRLVKTYPDRKVPLGEEGQTAA